MTEDISNNKYMKKIIYGKISNTTIIIIMTIIIILILIDIMIINVIFNTIVININDVFDATILLLLLFALLSLL